MSQRFIQERLRFETDDRAARLPDEIRAPGLTAEQDAELDRLTNAAGLTYGEALRELGIAPLEPAARESATRPHRPESQAADLAYDRLDGSGLNPSVIRARAGLN